VRVLFTLVMTFIRFIFSHIACLQDVSYYVTLLKCGIKFAVCTEKFHARRRINDYSSNEEVMPVHTMKA